MTTDFRAANVGLCKFWLGMAAFMQLLDLTIANASLPAIAGNLGATTQQSAWVVTSFGVCTAISMPLTGWLVRRFGEVRLFVVLTALFTLASVLCGFANSIGMLTVFRAIQGFVSGPIQPITQALMISLYPGKRMQAIALSTAISFSAPIAGPILGGWITDSYSWPWIFFINVPVGILCCMVIWNQLRHRPEKTQRVKMDYIGLSLLALGVASLQIMLDMGNEQDWFESSFITGAAIISAISIAAFLIWSLTGKEPIVDLHLFRHRNFTIGTVSNALSTGTFMAALVLLPMWMQTQLHYPAMVAGLAQSPSGVFVILLMPFISKHAHRFDLRMVATLGVVIITPMLFMRSYFTLDVDTTTIAMYQLLQGIGLPFFTVAVTTIMISDLKPEELSSGSGLAGCLRTLAGSFLVAITQYQWHHRSVLHHAQLAERFTPGSQATAAAVNSLGNGDTVVAMARLDHMINAQAFQISFNEMFYVFSLLFLALGTLLWLAKPPFHTSAGKPAGGKG